MRGGSAPRGGAGRRPDRSSDRTRSGKIKPFPSGQKNAGSNRTDSGPSRRGRRGAGPNRGRGSDEPKRNPGGNKRPTGGSNKKKQLTPQEEAAHEKLMEKLTAPIKNKRATSDSQEVSKTQQKKLKAQERRERKQAARKPEEEKTDGEKKQPKKKEDEEEVILDANMALTEDPEDDACEAAKAVAVDPYLRDEQENAADTQAKWTNKQRTLVLATRGITSAHRHLLEDIRQLMPHSKVESKWDKSLPFDEIAEAAELQNCNNVVLLEARRRRDLYMWMARCPDGPSVKFKVLNLHTMDSKNFMGNHLLGSRPLLVFDPMFKTSRFLQLCREMFIQMWGTPRNHPKSKPFHDHVLSFFVHDDKIWIRHYQVMSMKFTTKISDQELREVGPQLALEPIRLFDRPFGGKTLWKRAAVVRPEEAEEDEDEDSDDGDEQ